MKWKTFFKKNWLLVGIPVLLFGMFVFLQPLFAKDFIIAPNSTDRVSIGTTATPEYMLDVAGAGRFGELFISSTPTSETHAANKAYVDSVAATGGLSGSGTSNYLPIWTGTTSLGNSIVSQTATGIGISDTTPSYKLDVAGTGRFTGTLIVPTPTSGTHATNKDYVDSFIPATATSLVANGTNCSAGYYPLGVDASGNVESCTAVPSGGHGDGTNCSTGYYPLGVDAGGNVQSCTAVPDSVTYATRLDSDGTDCASGYYARGVDAYGNAELCTAIPTSVSYATTAGSLSSNGSNCSAGYYPLGVDASGNAEGCTPAATGGLSGSGTSNYLPIWTGTTSLGNSIVSQTATGIGISDTTPSYKLDVAGTGRFTGTLIVPTPTSGTHATNKDYVDSIIGGYVSGSGTANALTKWSSTSGLTSSRIADTGTGNVVVNAVLQATSFSGNATTATSLSSNGSNCSTGYYTRGVDASGNAENCTAIPTSVSYATTAGSLSSNGSNCSAGYYPLGVDASGNVESCTAVPSGGHGDGTNCSTGYYPLGVDAGGNVQSCTAVPDSVTYATRLVTDGTDCASGYYARGVDAYGNAELCTAVPSGGHGDGTNCSAGYYPLGVDANGNVQSCTAVPSGGHGDGTNCAAGYYARGVDANGNAQNCTALPTLPSDPTFNSVTAGSYYYSSDTKLKMNIKTISDPLEKITSLRGVTFNWKDSKEPSVGLIAQEVEKVFPELVGENGNYKAVEYGNLVAPLIEAIKAQQQQIEQLEARIMSLESSR